MTRRLERRLVPTADRGHVVSVKRLAILAPFLLTAAVASAAPGGTVSAAAHAGADAGAGAASARSCTKVRAYARPTAYGFTHVVELKNECKRTVSCDVSSDVNPQASRAVVEAGKTEEVVTFLESPASSFNARVTCSFASAK
jgi:hypothetical protein